MDAPPVQYVKTGDGYDIAYCVTGEGVPYVRVPSLWSHFSLQWDHGLLPHEFRPMAERFRQVLFDSRGQGASTRGLPPSTSLDDYVKDIEALVDHLGLERFVLSAVSAKGKVALRYAVRHPQRVIALLLRRYVDLHRRSMMYEMLRSDWSMYLDTNARVGWPWADASEVIRINRESMTQADHLVQYDALAAEPDEDLLGQVSVPTLVMAPREEAGAHGGQAEGRRVCARIPNARLVLFDDMLTPGFSEPEGTTPAAIQVINRFLQDLPDAVPAPASPLGLSLREIEVLRLLTAGRSNQQIADELVISLNTVRRHVSNIFDKAGVTNRAQAAVYARDHGLA